jgi:hypothetical protein
MIGQMRHWRQRLAGLLNTWLPASDTTIISLRPMPGELHRDGQPTEAFWQHLAELCAQGWLSGTGNLSLLPEAPRATLVSATGRTPLKPFGKLIIVTELARHDEEGPHLLHLVCTANGVAVARATSQLALARTAPPTRRAMRPLAKPASGIGSASALTR